MPSFGFSTPPAAWLVAIHFRRRTYHVELEDRSFRSFFWMDHKAAPAWTTVPLDAVLGPMCPEQPTEKEEAAAATVVTVIPD